MDLTCLLVSFQKRWGLKYWAAHPYQLPPILIIGKIDNNAMQYLVYSYFMPVCSIVKTITPRCRGRPDALLYEAEGRVQ